MKRQIKRLVKGAAALGLAVAFTFFAPVTALADGVIYVKVDRPLSVSDTTGFSQQPQQTIEVATSALESQVTFPAGVSFNDDFAIKVLPLVNQQRVAAGLPELKWNADAAVVAKLRATEIATEFSHTRPDGRDCLTAMDELGVVNPWRGENIAAGLYTPENVMGVWMESPGHRANILHEKFESVGIACCYIPNSEYGIYWVQLFVGYPKSK